MRRDAISLVSSEPVSRINLIEFDHDRIAMDLGDDRGGRNRNAPGVAVDDPELRGVQIERHRIDQEHVGFYVECPDRALHCAPVRCRQPDFIEFLSGDFGGADKGAAGMNPFGNRHSPPMGNRLRVLDVYPPGCRRLLMRKVRRNHNRGGDKRARKRSPADFIDPGDAAVTDYPELAFPNEHINRRDIGHLRHNPPAGDQTTVAGGKNAPAM